MDDPILASFEQVTQRLWTPDSVCEIADNVACEIPAALVYNGISHVVMMVSPTDLEDFALGFSLSEGILERPQQMLDFSVKQHLSGLELHIKIAGAAFTKLKRRRRQLVGRTGCGLCGEESLAQVLGSIPVVTGDSKVSHKSIDNALVDLPSHQKIRNKTGAVHAAAWCNAKGKVTVVREDVGRHNALDKVIGKLYRTDENLAHGFLVVTSRASYEMVLKSASANIQTLVAVSAPTTMAIELAEKCNITLVGFARAERHIVYAHAQRIID